MSMGVLDICSGYGGFSLGFERAGCRTVGFAEIGKFPSRLLAHHWPDVPNHSDISTMGGSQLTADIVTAGFPCQDLSMAGKRGGIHAARSGIFFEIMRVVREMRESGNGPAFVVLENVVGLLNSNGGRDFSCVLAALADLGALDIAWRVLDAQFFGVAQRRRRVFIVADFADERAAQILFESEGGSGDTATERSEGQDVAKCLTASAQRIDAETETFVTHPLTAQATPGHGHNGPRGVPVIANTVTTQNGTSSYKDNLPFVVDAMWPRRLTPTECERLQGLPDGWTDIPGASDTARYHAIGNGVAVPVVEWVAQRLMRVVQSGAVAHREAV